MDRYSEPKLEFRPASNHPLALEYALAYYPGCFTPTGLRDYHTKEVKQWCKDNNCGAVDYSYPYTITFRDEKELVWFLMRWT